MKELLKEKINATKTLKENYKEVQDNEIYEFVTDMIPLLPKLSFYLSTTNDEQEYDFNPDDYLSRHDVTMFLLCRIKIAYNKLMQLIAVNDALQEAYESNEVDLIIRKLTGLYNGISNLFAFIQQSPPLDVIASQKMSSHSNLILIMEKSRKLCEAISNGHVASGSLDELEKNETIDFKEFFPAINDMIGKFEIDMKKAMEESASMVGTTFAEIPDDYTAYLSLPVDTIGQNKIETVKIKIAYFFLYLELFYVLDQSRYFGEIFLENLLELLIQVESLKRGFFVGKDNNETMADSN